MKKLNKFVQSQLNKQGLNAGPEDGILGPSTMTALSQVDGIPTHWGNSRKPIAFVQILANENNIEAGPVDGYWGPQTSYAFDVLFDLLVLGQEEVIWRPENNLVTNPNQWPSQHDIEELVAFYGEAGENQSRVQLPYPHRLSWKLRTQINSFQCHERVADSIERVLQQVKDHYGILRIRELHLDIWGGCSVKRKMRGGSKPSMHSWGIAIDYDPNRNQLRWGSDKAAFARPDYDAWWSFWEEEGWVSLGKSRNFDWMHVQAAKT